MNGTQFADKLRGSNTIKQVVMDKVLKVKVVKRNEAKTVESVVSEAKARRSSREAAREIVSTVGDWVSEFKNRKQEETRAAIEMLLPKNPQTSGS